MGLIPEETISQVVDRCDIVEVVSSYIPLKKAGRNFKALCPFHHEKTPSFMVNPDKQIYHCFGCGVGGNVISFVMRQERLEFPEAMRMLAQRVGVTIPTTPGDSARQDSRRLLFKVNDLTAQFYHQVLLSGRDPAVQKARKYLKARNVTPEMVKRFRLGFAPNQWDGLMKALRKKDLSLKVLEKAGLIIPQEGRNGYYDRFRNRIIFPILDARSHCVGFGARAMEETGAKYINSPETEVYTKGRYLYGFNWAKESVGRKDSVIVAEGYMDFIMPFSSGIDNIVASLGTALTTDQIRFVRRYTRNVILLFDADQAGQAAMLRSCELLIEEDMNVKVALLAAGEDPDSFVQRYGTEKFYQKIEQAQSFFQFKLDRLLEENDVRTVEGKARIAGEMLPTISKFQNAVTKSAYLKELADAIKVDYQALAADLKKGTKAEALRGRRNTDGTQPSRLSQIRPVEYNLVRLLLEDDDLIPVTRQETQMEDFQSATVRTILDKIYQAHEKGNRVDAANVMKYFDETHVMEVLSALLALEDSFIGDKKRMHRDCLRRLHHHRLRTRRQNLIDQIKKAEDNGDEQTLQQLRQEYNQLIQKR